MGLPAEGMSAARIARRFGPRSVDRLLGSTGFVSDDTEQSALVAQSLALHPEDAVACAEEFRRSLLGLVLPPPVGRWDGEVVPAAACDGRRPSGVPSAGDGAAMRAAIVGVFFRDDPDARFASAARSPK